MISKTYNQIRRYLMVLLCFTFIVGGMIFKTQKIEAVANMQIHGGNGYNFEFVFEKADDSHVPGQTRSVLIVATSANAKGVSLFNDGKCSGHGPDEVEIGDLLLYVIITERATGITKIVLPEAIGHMNEKRKMVISDGSMSASGRVYKNTGTINFTFNGFNNDYSDTAYLTPIKIWQNADSSVITNPPNTPPFSNFTFTLISTTMYGTSYRQIPANAQLVVLNGEYTLVEGEIPGFELISISGNNPSQIDIMIQNRMAVVRALANGSYEVVFTNRRFDGNPPVTVSAEFDGRKQYTAVGGPLPTILDDMFGFTVRDEHDNIIAAGLSKANGLISFTPPLVYSSRFLNEGENIFTYYLEEDVTVHPRWTRDAVVYEITVIVTKTTVYEGQEVVSVSVDIEGPTYTVVGSGDQMTTPLFVNTYTNPPEIRPAAFSIEAFKVVEDEFGDPMTVVAGMWTFELFDDMNSSSLGTATNDASGLVFLKSFNYDDIGIHEYSIHEIGPSPAPQGWVMDTSDFIIMVTVSDPNGDGNLVVTPSYFKDGVPLDGPSDIVFVNVFHTLPDDPPGPKTGDVGTGLAIAILLMATTSAVLTVKRRKKD